MSESEDAEMTNAGQEVPPVGGAPSGSSSGMDPREVSATAIPKAPPKALVTTEIRTLLGVRGLHLRRFPRSRH